MKVILTADVENLGKSGELKEVSNGYARNFLIPKKLAVAATAGAVKEAEQRAEGRKRQEAKARQEAQALAQKLQGRTVRFTVRVGEQERLYGSVTSTDIAEKLQAETGIEIDRRKLDLEEAIKRTGNYPIGIKLAPGVIAHINVIVQGEGMPEPAAAPAEATGAEEALPEPE